MNCSRLIGQEKESPTVEYHRFTQAGAVFQAVSALFLAEYAHCCKSKCNRLSFALLHQMILAYACKLHSVLRIPKKFSAIALS